MSPTPEEWEERWGGLNLKAHKEELRPYHFDELSEVDLAYLAGQQDASNMNLNNEEIRRRDRNAMRARLALEERRAERRQRQQGKAVTRAAIIGATAGVIGTLLGVWLGVALDDEPAAAPAPVVTTTITTSPPTTTTTP